MNAVLRPIRTGHRLLPCLLAASWLALGHAAVSGRSAAPPTAAEARASLQTMSEQVRSLRDWAMRTGDHGGGPFLVIDKPRAHLWLFDAGGGLLGDSPVLLGLARGDHTVPGIGERRIQDIRPHERTTPAGRFVAEPGRNLSGEDVVWIDYDAAVSMHRVRATKAAERRLQRLDSPTPADNRISYGCVNLPVAFYDAHIQPLFRDRRAVVYVLPDTLPMERVFGAIQDAPPAR
jgi:hypothetical protein